MDYEVMKKKLDAYRKSNGQFRSVKGELLIELLRMWELHKGPSVEFARKLGMKSKQLGRLIQSARKLATTTDVVDSTFHELKSQGPTEIPQSFAGIEMTWGSDKIIRFPTVDALMDFLKKAS